MNSWESLTPELQKIYDGLTYLNMILNELNEARNEGRKEGEKIAHKKGTLIFNLFVAISVLAIHQMFVVYLTGLLSHYAKTIEPTSATAWALCKNTTIAFLATLHGDI
ncbi:unnamed protein product [Rhizophagus irregularis]|nr:unnamed protein product [Rhizophagus irregularis]